MTKSEKTQATEADTLYGKNGWAWADEVGDNDKRILIHSTNCRCQECYEIADVHAGQYLY